MSIPSARPSAVIVIGAGVLQTYLIAEAHALGLAVIATDGDKHAPGFAKADDYVVVSTYDTQATVAMLEPVMANFDVRGVCTAGADVAPTVAYVAERFGLRGIPYVVAQRTHNKALVRQTLEDAGLAAYQPAWMRCDMLADDGYTIGDAFSYPYILKPLDQRASRGVTIVREPRDLDRALARLASYGSHHFLCEAYLAGTEHSAEMILDNDGEVLFFNIVDRFFDYRSGVPIELGHVNPTCLSWENQLKILGMVKAAAGALGVTWGPFKVDVLMTREEVREGVWAPMDPYLLECTTRLSGGFDAQVTSPMTQRYPLRMLLQLACGFPVDSLRNSYGYAACAAIISTKYGRVTRLPRLDHESQAVIDVIWAIQPGDMLHKPTHNAERHSFVFCHAAESRVAWLQAIQSAILLGQSIEIEEEKAKLSPPHKQSIA